MNDQRIITIESRDVRFPLFEGAGSDAVHSSSEYAFATTLITTEERKFGTGIALTLGNGNQLVCEAIEMLGGKLTGCRVEVLMANFGEMSRQLANDPQLRWLGPHKGVVHLALASITNACFDLWAKSRQVPLWKLLIDLTAAEVVRLLDLSYLEDVLCEADALELLREPFGSRAERKEILKIGYPGYDTSVGWIAYDDDKVRELTARAIENGFKAFKLKVGSEDENRDLRRAEMLRNSIGGGAALMFDANQRWDLTAAIRICRRLGAFAPLWIEEPTHPDDIHAHAVLAAQIAPVKIAVGEHIPNRILFKNFMQAGAVHYVQ